MDRRIALVVMLLPAGCSDGDVIKETTVPPVPPPDLTCFETCFDADPCTDDMCQADGTCIHVPANPFEACQTEAHCDDGNSCTDDTCALDDCGNMRCQHFWRSGCQPCFMGCDDRNPCTTDTCVDGECVAGPADEHCDPNCRLIDALSPNLASTFYDPSGGVQHYVGVVTPVGGLNCGFAACTCQSQLALGEAGIVLPMRNATADTQESWSCEVAACEPRNAECAPMKDGVGYVAWGVMRYLVARAAGAQQVPQPSDTASTDVSWAPPIDAFEVQGYCLSPRWDHVPGRYQATFESDGLTASFELTVDPGFGLGAIGHMGECTGCAALGVPEQQEIQFDPNTDMVGLTFAFTRDGAAGHAWLFSHADEFSGDVRKLDGTFVGMLTLERLAP